MPTLILDDVPQALFDNLQRRATADRKSLPEVTLDLLQDAVEPTKQVPITCGPRYPEWIPHQEISAPFDLPFSTPGVLVQAIPGEAPLPDISDLPPDAR